MSDFYHVCRWCRWYDKQKCINPYIREVEVGGIPVIDYISEQGELAEIIKEGFTEVAFTEFEEKLRLTKLSQKAKKELLSSLGGDIENIKKEWEQSLDEALCNGLRNKVESHLQQEAGMTIKEPSEFYCKFFE